MAQVSIPEDYVLLGQLGKTFQLAGLLRFYPLGDAEAEAVRQAKQVFIAGVGLCDIREVRLHAQQIMIAFGRALSVEAAKALVNHEVYLHRDDLPAVEDDAYISLLIGLPVYLAENMLGEVKDILTGDLQDTLIIEGPRGPLLLPLQAPYVQLEEDRITLVDPPEGLLELNA